MSIENLLSQLIESNNAVVASNKELVAAINATSSFVQADNGAQQAEAPKRTRRTKAEIAADEAAANSASTEPSYYVLEATMQVFEVPAGGPAPERFSAQVTKEVYEQKKAEFEAKKAEAVATTQAPAATEPTATAPAASASVETSSDGAVTFEQVRDALMALAKDPAHGALAVKTILTNAAPGVARVPELQGSEFLPAVKAAIDALLNPADADLF